MRRESLPPGLLHLLQETKHRAAVARKHAGWGFPTVRGPLLEPYFRWRQERDPQRFPRDRYAGQWFAHDLPGRAIERGEPVPRRIFVLWTGDNPLTPNRARHLASIREVNADLEVVLITPDNLGDWLVAGHPLPAQYRHLSFVHRSDVLRGYLLHHHGGGYADLKRPLHRWAPAFDRLEASDAWLLGYTETYRLQVPAVGGELYRDLRANSRQLLGYGGLIARANTPLTAEWDAQVRAVLAQHSTALAAYPGNTRGDNPGYPIGWTQVLAHIVAPLTWKYQDHVLHDERVLPELRRYT